MSSDQARAAWQSAPCPSWCTQRHHDDDHPDDRYHDSVAVPVASTVMQRDRAAGPGQWVEVPAELTVVTSRHADPASTAETVTFIGRADRTDQQLQLSPGSAKHLAEAILEHLATIDEP